MKNASDAFIRAWTRAARARWSDPISYTAFLPLLALPALVPLFRSSFLVFLDEHPDRLGEGMEAVLMRVGLVLVGWAAIDTYGALVRSPDRAVLAILPVDPRAVVRMALGRLGIQRWFVVPLFALLLAPVAGISPWLWCVALVALAGLWSVALVASAAVHLFAVEVAESATWAPVLDGIRGYNPRASAAFIYAPGAVLLGLGGIVAAVARAVPAAAGGDGAASLVVAVPFVLAAVAAVPLGRLAESNWYRATAVLSDIDARYASARTPEEARHVYLDGLVRFLPGAWRPFALRDLRHGWRAERTPVTGAWLLACVAAAAAWTDDPAGPTRAVLVAVAAVETVGVVGALLAAREPVPLRAWFPETLASRAARASVLSAWLQPLVLVPACAVLLRAPWPKALVFGGFAELAVAASVGVSLLVGRFGDRAVRAYAPLAALAGGVVAVVAVGVAG